jgi:hypothetical protein
MQQNSQRVAARLLAIAALLLVIALGLVFEAMLAHELLKRSHRWALRAQPAQETYQWTPGQGVCPARPHWDPHHGHRERLTISTTAAPCLPPALSI